MELSQDEIFIVTVDGGPLTPDRKAIIDRCRVFHDPFGCSDG